MAGKQGHRGWGKITQLPSKRWRASYIGPDLARHAAPNTFSAKMDAEHWLTEERRTVERGEWTPPSVRAAAAQATAMTLAEYASTWVEQRPIKARTRIGYQALLDAHIAEHAIGKLPIRYLTGEAVRAWYAKLDKSKVRRNSHAYGLLHAVCATAVKDGLLQQNPCQIERVMNPARKREPVILTTDELAQLANTIAPLRFRSYILVAAWCGLRWGEMIELRRADVALDGSVIVVSRGVTHRGECRIDTPKSGRGRTVVVPPHIRKELTAHLATLPDAPDTLLWPAARGGCHLNDRVMRDYLAPALSAIGKPQLRIHDLRHFAGTQTARVANLPETMARLGHSTPKASLGYQAVISSRDDEIAAALSKLATVKPRANGRAKTVASKGHLKAV